MVPTREPRRLVAATLTEALLANSCKLGHYLCKHDCDPLGKSFHVLEDDANAPADPLAADDGGGAEVEDLAVLDVEAATGEVMTAVHWIEDHTPGLGTHGPHDPDPVVTAPIKPVRRRSRVVVPIPT